MNDNSNAIATVEDGYDSRAFDEWWHNEGSGVPPAPGEDSESHVRRLTRIAWHNGAFKAREHQKTMNETQVATVDWKLLCSLHNSGYQAGHNDTVESCFTHMLPVDQDTYHLDVVQEIVADLFRK